MIKPELVAALLAVPVIGGMAMTRLRFLRQQREAMASRMAPFAITAKAMAAPLDLLKKEKWNSLEPIKHLLHEAPGLPELKALLHEAGIEDQLSTFIGTLIILLVAPLAITAASGFNVFIGLAAGCVLDFVALLILKGKADRTRDKFCEQLPDAIDLMVAVLRSGHSVSQSVKAVSQEIPQPCGREFDVILQRMNLGQPLSESLMISTRRFRSFELDLMARAVAIQAEVGGSLAELLDKTNSTLRQRLRLSRQINVLTAQSRLSARIVGVLPIVLAVVLNVMSPGYLQTLVRDQLGQFLLSLALALQIVGVLIMRQMSTMRV
ncbi:MAG TPA: type II secretion system F family protein [Planktothrix sp.]|jgi:tight adherence protein B